MESFQEPFHITDTTPDDLEEIRTLRTSGSLSLKVQYFGESKRKAITADYASNTMERIDLWCSGAKRIPRLLVMRKCQILPIYRFFPKIHRWIGCGFIYKKDFNPDLIRYVLCEIFYRENKIRYVIVVQCPDYGFESEKDRPNYYSLEQLSAVFYPNSFSAISCPNTQQIHMIYRDDIIPKMRYRRALPKDNDDIVELVNNDRPDIKEELGEYYIAEELY